MSEITLNDLNARLHRIENLLTNQQAEEPKNFTLPEAAKYCKMAVPSFRHHLSLRRVIGSKPGKHWIFTKKDLDTFLENHRVTDVSPSDYLVNNRRR